jgi:hypothetical protein
MTAVPALQPSSIQQSVEFPISVSFWSVARVASSIQQSASKLIVEFESQITVM